MKRTTISLPEDLAGIVERDARLRQTSVSEIVRQALNAHYGLDKPRELPFANLGRSKSGWGAANLDEYLDKYWANDIYPDASDRNR